MENKKKFSLDFIKKLFNKKEQIEEESVEEELTAEESSAEETEIAEIPEEEQAEAAKKKRTKRIIYFSVFGFFCALFMFSAICLIDYFVISSRENKKYGNLSDGIGQIQDSLANNPTNPDGSLIIDPNKDYPFDINSPILPEYQAIYELNDDVIGWIRIDGTTVNYPVMHRPEEKEYYLYRNFYHEYNKRGPGSIFLREKCDPFKPSDNLIIYGHYKQDGTMFHDLHGYYSRSYWEEHPFIQFDTLYERHTYQILAVFKTDVASDDFYPYHKFNDAKTPMEFDNFIDTVKRMSFYDTGVDATFGDKLITLSTCEYTLTDGRLVVVAKRIN